MTKIKLLSASEAAMQSNHIHVAPAHRAGSWTVSRAAAATGNTQPKIISPTVGAVKQFD